MKRSILFIFSVAVAVMALIAACGSGGGGGSERFSTVEIFASYNSSVYEADAQVLVDQDNDGTCDFASTIADQVIAEVCSTSYDPLPDGVAPCDVNILRYNLRYYPQTGDSVQVPTKQINQSISIPAPGSAGDTLCTDISVELFDNNQKNFINPFFFASPDPEFQYDIKVSLTMEEVCTRIREDVDFWISVRYFDLATDNCN